jgi:hypothetical protein
MNRSTYARATRRVLLIMLLAALVAVPTACTYRDRVAPIRLPETAANMVEINGLRVSAQAYTEGEAAEAVYGFDARAAGLLPVQVTFQNDGSLPVSVNPDQTFLIDNRQNAWPILSKEKTYERTRSFVDIGETAKGTAKPALLLGAAGALAGAAIGIVTGNNVGEAMGKGAVIGAAAGAIGGGANAYVESGRRISEDLAGKTLTNRAIQPGQIAYGTIFFPGTTGSEAENAHELRLSLTFGYNEQRALVINLDDR